MKEASTSASLDIAEAAAEEMNDLRKQHHHVHKVCTLWNICHRLNFSMHSFQCFLFLFLNKASMFDITSVLERSQALRYR